MGHDAPRLQWYLISKYHWRRLFSLQFDGTETEPVAFASGSIRTQLSFKLAIMSLNSSGDSAEVTSIDPYCSIGECLPRYMPNVRRSAQSTFANTPTRVILAMFEHVILHHADLTSYELITSVHRYNRLMFSRCNDSFPFFPVCRLFERYSGLKESKVGIYLFHPSFSYVEK